LAATIAVVVGGWTVILVAFAVASTHTLAVSQRATELAVLRSIGATSRQVRRQVLAEATGVAVAAAATAIPLAVPAGLLVLHLLRRAGLVAGTVGYRFGAAALVMGFSVTFLAATIGALVAARRATAHSIDDGAADALADPVRLSRSRLVVALLLLAGGYGAGLATIALSPANGADARR
jgi:putative ABC transport system permease protein